MTWIALCHDRADIDTSTLRRAERDRHFAYIETILDRLLVAGPLAPREAGEWRASLFVYAVEERTEAELLLQADPYHQAGIYGTVQFMRFTPAAGRWIGGTVWGAKAPA